MRWSLWLCVGLLLACGSTALSQDAPAPELIQDILKAAGGAEKLPTLFRIQEKLILGENPNGSGSKRTTILEPPKHWWQGKRDRVVQEKEPAIFLVWAWTLRPLVDPQSKLATAPETTVADRPAVGITISQTIDPPLTMYFDRETKRLVRLDWRKDQNVLSDWKEADGFHYPARCTGIRANGRAWYHTEILSFERLSELPPELKQ